MEGVCRSLKIRIEQILVSQQGSILFKISNFLKLKEKSYSANIFGNFSASLGISSLIRKILF